MPLYNINSGPRGFLQPNDGILESPSRSTLFRNPPRWRGMWAYGQTLKQMADPSISFTTDVIQGNTFWSTYSLPFWSSVWTDRVTCDAMYGFGTWDGHQLKSDGTNMTGVTAFSFVLSYWIFELPTDVGRHLWCIDPPGFNGSIGIDQNGGHWMHVVFQDYTSIAVGITYLGLNKLHTVAGWISGSLGQMGLHQKDGPYQESSALGAKTIGGLPALGFATNGANGYNAVHGAGAYGALYSSILPLPVLKNLAQDPYHYHIR